MATPLNPDQPPSTRVIAKLAGVSSTAVSMALRNHPKISAATRERVQKIADELGYRIDPRLAKLMHHLREVHRPGFQSTLCAMTSIPPGTESAHSRDIMQSARQRGQTLGYGLEMVYLDDTKSKRENLHRRLYSRGVEGVLLLPMKSPRVVTDLLRWEKFSALAATYGVLAPNLHRVVPHQFSNTQKIYQELARRGYRRIGLVISELHDIRSNHSYTSAFAGLRVAGGTEVVRSLIHPGTLPVNVRGWFDQEQPDVVVAAGEADCRAVAAALPEAALERLDFAVLARSGKSDYAGIDEQAAEIGKTAVDMLHAQIQASERGVPVVPRVTMIGGRWIDGPSLRRPKPAVGLEK